LAGELLDLERIRLVEALKASGGRVNRAAAALGLSPQSLSYKMRKHGLNRDSFMA
jgi:transcriptional regulator with GAF, ATPase, and Fis domain